MVQKHKVGGARGIPIAQDGVSAILLLTVGNEGYEVGVPSNGKIAKPSFVKI
jgi:hypothetical protein